MEKNSIERDVNLIDMFWAVCLKWRYIIIWGMIFAILAGSFSYIQSVKAKEAMESVEKVSLQDVELESNSQRNVDAYLDYVDIYEKQKKYNDEALIMQLDANGFYRSIVTFYVDNHYTVEYPLVNKINNVNAMIEAYRAELRSDEFTEKIREMLALDDDTLSCSMELIDCNNRYGENTANINAGIGIMTVSIYGTDEQMCIEMSKLVKETIEAKKGKVTEVFGEHDVSLIEDECDFEADNELLKYQKENIDKLVAYSNSLRDMKLRLTEEELAYIDIYENEYAEGEGKEKNSAVVEVGISKKAVIGGFVVGAVLVGFILIFMYLTNNRLQLEDEFERLYGIKLLGNVIVKRERKKKIFGFVDKFFIKMRHLNKHYFSEEEAISMVVAGIKIGAKKLGTTKVYVTGATVGEEEKIIIEKLRKELDKVDIQLILGKPILYDAEALEQSVETGYVVLMERAGVSLYSEITEEAEVCDHQGIKVLGTVVIA